MYTERESNERDALEEQYMEGSRFLGILGALGGSILGVILWVIIYQLGYISSIAGIAMFFLVHGGYCKIGKNKLDLFGIIVSIIISIVMLFVAEMVSIVALLYMENSRYGITVMECISAVPRALVGSETEVIKDLLFGYLFMILGTAGHIWNLIKEARQNTTIL